MLRSLPRHTLWLTCSLLACLVSAAEGQEPLAARIAPLINQQTLAVASIDLASLNPDAVLARWKETSPANGPSEDVRQGFRAAIMKLREAKVNELFIVLSLDDLPENGPFVAVRPQGDHEAVADMIRQVQRNWQSASVGEFLVVGHQATIERLKGGFQASVRQDLQDALAAPTGMLVRVAVVPNADVRRAITETLVVPPEFGGEDTTHNLKALTWVSLGITFEPKLNLRLVARTSDEASAQRLTAQTQALVQQLVRSEQVARVLPSAAGLAAGLRSWASGNTMHVSLAQDDTKPADVGGLFAPLRSARAAARRNACINNMKQLGLAMHNYADAHRNLPPAAITDKNGRPLLSWRVTILPFIDQVELYNQFRLDEPWDSEHNKSLIAKMPATYACPAAPAELRKEGKTTYLVAVGEAGLFRGKEGPRFQDIRDGTSNTLMIVDAAPEAAVIWTKPDDLVVDPEQPLKGLVSQHEEGFVTTFVDCSVQFISKTIAPETLRLLFHPNDGRPVPKF